MRANIDMWVDDAVFAKSSTGEVKSMLYIAERVGYCEKDKALKMRNQCEEISKIIRGLMKSLLR